MFVTAKMLAAEIGVAPRTISDHVRAMERSGNYPGIRAKIGRPREINREMFLHYVYGDAWRESEKSWRMQDGEQGEEPGENQKRATVCNGNIDIRDHAAGNGGRF